ncbi:hypothetical protein QR680_006694 [Steinernema hermaphroditum]|uniref:Post-GPI attachment to proteins factor 3 n=1 Tax=Steinernema hermaphroditum TaxID=289476 RepID=A0AA39HW78_9BILA|nr:hypothetical protein QR680_006694 [Steinernema hermaphroditum]
MKSPIKVAQDSVANLPFWAMVVLSFQIIGIFFAAMLAPFALRSAVLPSLADYEHPLYFTFTTCFDQLHGVCSYPEARFHLGESDLNFATDTPYSLSVDFDFTPADPEFPLGVFLVTLQVYDENQTGLASYQRSTVFKDPRKSWSLYRLIRNAFFFPLYMIGYFETAVAGRIHIDFTKSFMDRATRPASFLVVQVQSRYIQIENAKLSVAAHFGLLRYLLYQWPIVSYIIVFTGTFASLFCCLMIARAYYYFTQEEAVEVKKDAEETPVEQSEVDDSEDERPVKKWGKPFHVEESRSPLKEGDTPKFPVWNDIPGIEAPKLPPRPLQVVGLASHVQNDNGALRQRKLNDVMNELESQNCPGFCGRNVLGDNTSFDQPLYSDCGACEWGYRAINKFACTPCTTQIEAYDYLYLVFNAIATCLVHCFFIHYYAVRANTQHSLRTMLGHLSCFLESLCAFLLSVLVLPPMGSPFLHGCTHSGLREWYPMFYNPFFMHVKKLRCTYEIVYPLYSLPFIFFALNLFFLMIFRSIYCIYASRNVLFSSKPYYAALWALPVISTVHATLAGIIYYSFPYLSLLTSLALIAVFMAFKGRITMREMLKKFTIPSNIIILSSLTAFFGFAIFSLGVLYSMATLTAAIIADASACIVPLPWVVEPFGGFPWRQYAFISSLYERMSPKLRLPCAAARLQMDKGSLFQTSGGFIPDEYYIKEDVSNCLETTSPAVLQCLESRRLFDVPFECRYECMWKTVDLFADDPPQFFGKWPFTAWWIGFGSHFYVIQEPASVIFSVMNFIAVYAMYMRIKKSVSLRYRMRKVWLGYCIVGMAAWTASIYFHSIDFWFSEILDYFSACALIVYAFFASISFTFKPLHRTPLGRVLWFVIGGALLIFYLNHISSLWEHFDYGYNMKCCVICSIVTALIYLGWLLLEWLRGRSRRSTQLLLRIILWSFGALAFELLDFAPILWTIDAHSLFHLATVPVPMWLAEFVLEEAEFEGNEAFKCVKQV